MEAVRRSKDEMVEVMLTHPAIDVNIKSKVRQCCGLGYFVLIPLCPFIFVYQFLLFFIYVLRFVFLVFCSAMYLWVL
jgi:hypothetical protein